jgi:hypothetical protein
MCVSAFCLYGVCHGLLSVDTKDLATTAQVWLCLTELSFKERRRILCSLLVFPLSIFLLFDFGMLLQCVELWPWGTSVSL